MRFQRLPRDDGLVHEDAALGVKPRPAHTVTVEYLGADDGAHTQTPTYDDQYDPAGNDLGTTRACRHHPATSSGS